MKVISSTIYYGPHSSYNFSIVLFLKPGCVNNQFSIFSFHKVLFSFILNSQCCLSDLNYSIKQLEISLLPEYPLKTKTFLLIRDCCYMCLCECTQFLCKSGHLLYLMLSIHVTGLTFYSSLKKIESSLIYLSFTLLFSFFEGLGPDVSLF